MCDLFVGLQYYIVQQFENAILHVVKFPGNNAFRVFLAEPLMAMQMIGMIARLTLMLLSEGFGIPNERNVASVNLNLNSRFFIALYL